MHNNKSMALLRDIATTIAGLTLVSACTMAPPSAKDPAPPPAPIREETPAPPPLSTAESKSLAQKRAIEARDLLQNGEEKAASEALDQALLLDTANELARKLADQIAADPEQELGVAHFDYTIQAGDSLSRLAERFLGDRMRFYILARYNGIANPSRVAVGQTVKIPGRAPKSVPSQAAPATPAKPAAKGGIREKPAVQATPAPVQPPPPAAPTAVPPEKPTQAPAVEPAHTAAPVPPPTPAADQARRKELARRYNQEALAAFHKQDLDTAIRKWGQVLELEPDNESARLNRARALDLKSRIEKFPKQ